MKNLLISLFLSITLLLTITLQASFVNDANAGAPQVKKSGNTSETTDQAKAWYLFVETRALVNTNSSKINGLSVRCIIRVNDAIFCQEFTKIPYL